MSQNAAYTKHHSCARLRFSREWAAAKKGRILNILIVGYELYPRFLRNHFSTPGVSWRKGGFWIVLSKGRFPLQQPTILPWEKWCKIHLRDEKNCQEVIFEFCTQEILNITSWQFFSSLRWILHQFFPWQNSWLSGALAWLGGLGQCIVTCKNRSKSVSNRSRSVLCLKIEYPWHGNVAVEHW